MVFMLMRPAFTQDYVPPSVTTYSPALSATGVSSSTNIILTFSENIQRGSGTIWLEPSGGNGPNNVLTIAISNTAQVAVVNNQAIINPTNALVDHGGKTYKVTMLSGAFRDTAGNNYGGIFGSSYTFTVADSAAPTVSIYSPTQGITGVAKDTFIVLTFNENVAAGTGNIVITPSGGNGADTPITIAVGDATQVSFSTTALTINPTNDLVDLGAKTHTITLASGVVAYIAGNTYGGLSGSTFAFTVADSTNPTVTTYGPAQAATGVSNAANIVITFDEYIQAGSGNIVLTPTDNSNQAVSTLTIPVSDGQVTFSTTLATINPSSNLIDHGDKAYTVTMSSGVIKDSENNPYAGLSGTTYVFTAADSENPVVVTYSPAQNAGSASKSANIVLTFNENMLRRRPRGPGSTGSRGRCQGEP